MTSHIIFVMRWSIYNAKARLSELVAKTATDGPQIITCRGEEKAVLVSIDEWKRTRQAPPHELKDVLLGRHIDPLLDPHGPALDHIDWAEIRRQFNHPPRPVNFDE